MSNECFEQLSLGEFIKDWKVSKIEKKSENAQLDSLKQVREQWVTKNRSGLMSAFIKCMRMQNMNHALYYGAIMLLGGQSKWYISRRVVISATEDGNDQNVMKYVVDMYRKPDSKKTYEDILMGVVAVCLGKNWWNDPYGRVMMRKMFQAKKLDINTKKSDKELLDDLRECLFEGGEDNFCKSIRISDAIAELMDAEEVQIIASEMAMEKAETTGDEGLYTVGEYMENIVNDLVRYHDWNWEFVVRYMTCVGSNPEPADLSDIEKYRPLVQKILEVADQDSLQLKTELPPYAYDNCHASNKAVNDFGGDKRFAGTPQGFYNCLLMYKKNNRIDPRDQAELNGLQVPDRGRRWCNEHVTDIKA